MSATTDEKVLRAGVIGLGSMGRHHARVMRSTPGMELVAVADPGGDRFGVAQDLPVLEDVETFIAAGLDMAVVAVPTVHHEAVALALAEAGVPTMVEKPIAHSVEAGERVAAAFDAAGVVGCVGYVERCNPATIAMRERIQQGLLGEIYQITTSRQGPFPPRITDVGVIQDLATHDVDLTPWIAGSDYDRLIAHVQHRSGRDKEDMLVATGRLANGVIVNHLVNWLSPRKERQCIATGERGALVLDPDIVLFDEPDSGLDPVRTALLCELIQEIHQENGGAYVVITHDIMSARRVAEHISVLWKGRIVESGPAEELFESDNAFVRQFLSGESQGPLGME